MRIRAGIVVLALALSCAPAMASNRIAEGKACNKLNQVIQHKQQVLNCRFSPTGSTWIKLFSKKKLSSYEKTKLTAYSEIMSALEQNGSAQISIKYWISDYFPKELSSLYKSQIELSNKLYGTFFQKKEVVNVYMYTEKDSKFLDSYPIFSNEWDIKDRKRWFNDWSNGIGREHNLGLAAFYSEYPNKVWSGHAGLIVHSSSTKNSLRKYAIQVMPHEYFHVVQDYFFRANWEDFLRTNGRLNENGMDVYDSFFPPIFREGSANTISFAISSNKPIDYLNLYKYFIDEKKDQKDVNLFAKLNSVSSSVQVLKSMEYRNKNDQAHEASYSIGQLVFEWLIAEYGFGAYKRLVENQLIGSNFEDNLKASVGISLEELYRKSAPHVMAAFN